MTASLSASQCSSSSGVGRARLRRSSGDVTVGRLVASAVHPGRGPGDDVGPQRRGGLVLDRVVAEQVGVGEHHDPALAGRSATASGGPAGSAVALVAA